MANYSDPERVRQNQTEQLDAELQLELVFSLLTEAVIFLNNDFRIIQFSPAAEKMFGYSREDVLGETLDRFLPEGVAARHHQLMKQFVSSDEPTKYMGGRPEIFGRRANGDVFPAEAAISRRETERGVILSVVVQDLSQQKSAEKALLNNQALLSAVLNSFPGALIIRDLEDRNLVVNKEFCNWYQVDRDEVIGRRSRHYLPKEILASTTRQENEVLETHKAVFAERRVTFPDGETRDVLSLKFPIFGEDGECVAIGTAVSDLSNSKAMAASLKEREELLRAVFDTSPFAITVKDADGRYLMVNDTFTKWMMTDAAQIIGQTPYDLYPREFAADGMANDKNVFENGQPKTTEDVRKFRDGQLRNVVTYKRPIRSDAGEIVATCTAMIDVTYLKKIEKDLALALADAVNASRAKSNFLAIMSHEFKTPLNAILGFSEIMNSQHLGPLGNNAYVEYVHCIFTAGQHLLSLVNDLLDISKIESGNFKLYQEPIILEEILDECQKMLEHRATESGISWAITSAEYLPPLHADRRAIRQILLNLLSNAVKFTPAGGRVDTTANIRNGAFVIEVRDTGRGIAESEIQNVTNPFERGNHHAYLAKEGTGLGLAISKSLVEQHGGTLTIESVLGKGTTVTVSLPVSA